jgi:hypothetical protein
MKLLYNYLALFLIFCMLAASMSMKKQVRPARGPVTVAEQGLKTVVFRGDR